VPPRPLVLSAGLQLTLLGGALFGAALALQSRATFGWYGVSAALTCFAAISMLVLLGLSHHSPHRRFGVANSVTLTRAAVDSLMVGVVTETLLGGSLVSDTTLSWILVATATTALVLDGVDGWAARRTGMASDFGAHFDMETDALFLLMLALLVQATGKVGMWVLASGSMRYAFVLAAWAWPALGRPLPPLRRRKIVYAVQVSVLIAALAPVVSAEAAQAICLTGLGLLGWSFGADCIWLARQARRRR
jgi:phosphatidylglycerophosphate synthase